MVKKATNHTFTKCSSTDDDVRIRDAELVRDRLQQLVFRHLAGQVGAVVDVEPQRDYVGCVYG